MIRLLALAVLLLAAGSTMPVAARALSLYEQREAYRQALDHLTAGRSAEFERGRAALEDYLLAPYLASYDVQMRLAHVSDAEMAAFQANYGELPVAGVLHHRWLKHLGSRREWQRLLANYRPSRDPELGCYHARAQLATGQRDAALEAAAALWTVANSQPKACDPLFETWIAADLLTEGRVWQRLQLALEAGDRRLGRYLLRFFDGPLAVWAQALYDVHVDPARIGRRGAVAEDNGYARVVIGHGLRRLSRSDPAAALKAWQRLQDTHDFGPADARAISETLLLAQARAGTFPSRRPTDHSAGFADGMADAALRAENWSELLYWVDHLPGEQKHEPRWQYWLARALNETHLGSERARLTYQSLAERRHYYGFLAAERINRAPNMNPAIRSAADPLALARLRALPGLRRSLELYAVGDLVNARREWYALLGTLDATELFYAAQLAREVGWVAQSIFTANQANLHDDLELRFPVAYPDLFQRVSHVTAVPQPFLLAVARQESAFDSRARSPANARGLMQLMHPTANQVASRLGVDVPSTADLYDPGVSVELGGHHLAELLSRYANRRPLAAAAYNAGEGRVDRWIRDRRGLPMDVWIETIPFNETRSYVKNVLAFTQVYGSRLGKPGPMLERHENAVN
ncbi:MAG: transglycosylase SLT domain-containing protein [Pseudomonadales bacterium]